MALQSHKIITRENGKPVDKESSALELLLSKIGIGPSDIPIEEVAGVVSIGSRAKAYPAVSSDELLTKNQLDTESSGLQTQITQNANNILALQNSLNQLAALVGTNDADLAAFSILLNKIFNSPPIEEYFIATAGQTIFNATTLEWNPDNTIYDILVYANGEKRTVDVTGGLTEDYRKNSGTQLEFAYPLTTGTRVTIRHGVRYLNTQFFVHYVTGYQGFSIPVGENFSNGANRLSAFRNGLYMAQTSNPAIGGPVDRYVEKLSLIELEEASLETTYWVMLHKSVAPTFRSATSGLVGGTLTVPSYNMGTDRFLAFRNGLLLNKSALGTSEMQYSEATPTSITVPTPSIAATMWIFEELGQAPVWREEFSGITGPTLTFSAPYTMGNGKLLLFRNGVLVMNTNNTDYGGPGPQANRYVEATPTTVTLEVASTASTVWTAINLS